jgi:hypothetical protein
VPHDVDASAIIGTRWVHVFEEDTQDGAVYRPDTGPIPLSRRPREAMILRADGSATLESGGPDDRPLGRPGRWSATPDGIAVRADGNAGRVLTIVHATADSLTVR